jgi:hypothetical protein
MDAVLLMKTMLAPSLIGIASWISRRFGPSAGGWFSALPLTSGPVVLVLALQRGPGFACEACVGTVLALISLAGFVLVYSRSAGRLDWKGSSSLACAVFLGCTWLLRNSSVRILAAFFLVCMTLVVVHRFMPLAIGLRSLVVAPAWDIPIRMLLALVLVSVLTSASGLLGARLSGLLTPFPIAASILAGATHHFEGAEAVRDLLRSMLVGLISFAVFFLIVGETLAPWGITSAFLLAALVSLAVHGCVWKYLQSISSIGGVTHE